MKTMESEPVVPPNSVLENEELQSDSVNAVFNIPELREMIISRAIYIRRNSQPVLCRKTIPSLRLMSKEWLSAVSKILRTDKEPLFQLILTNTNSLNGTRYVQKENGKLLDNFVNRVYTAPWNQEKKPTFSLQIGASFFRAENYHSLLNCLLNCGKDLLKLDVVLPINGGSLTCIFPPFSLPALQSLTVHLKGTTIKAQLAHGESLVGYSANITNLLNCLLNASSSLEEITMPYYANGKLPPSFHFISLPKTITRLDLSLGMTSEELGILIRNRLPNLCQLSLVIPEIPFADGLLFQVLDNYKTSLERVCLLVKKKVSRNQETLSLLRFPKMERLTSLKIVATNCQLEPNIASLELCFPALTCLVLAQTETGFRKWTENSKFVGVKQLSVGIPNQEAIGRVSINLENMQLLHQSFPNVQDLTLITSSSGQTCGIKYLFMEMKQLKSLKFFVNVTDPEQNSDYWDALFTGVSEEIIKGLRLSPEFWGMVSLENVSVPSICMLQELEKLSIECVHHDLATSNTTSPLISDLAFIHAFLKMPKLNVLELQGRFQASQKMTDIWKNKGNTLC